MEIIMANVSVWNASVGVVKVGANKLILHPGESIVTEMHDSIAFLESKGSVVVSPIEQVTNYSAPATTRKKKDTQIEEVVTVDIDNKESSEDSILPKETD